MIKTMHKEEIKLLLRWVGWGFGSAWCGPAGRAGACARPLPEASHEGMAWNPLHLGLVHHTAPTCHPPALAPGLAHSALPRYYRHVEANPETLLTRFYGVHRVKPSHGRKVGAWLVWRAWKCVCVGFGEGVGDARDAGVSAQSASPGLPAAKRHIRTAKPTAPHHPCTPTTAPPTTTLHPPTPLQPIKQVRFVVMNNVFRTDLDLHRKYDLKGSTFGRTAGPRPSASGARGGGVGAGAGACRNGACAGEGGAEAQAGGRRAAPATCHAAQPTPPPAPLPSNPSYPQGFGPGCRLPH